MIEGTEKEIIPNTKMMEPNNTKVWASPMVSAKNPMPTSPIKEGNMQTLMYMEKTLPNIDVLDSEFIDQALNTPGPWVSIFVPTHRTGRETLMARDQLGNLLSLVEQRLQETGYEDSDALLAQARELTQTWDFWQQQADGQRADASSVG